MKNRYISLMNRTLDAYSIDHIHAYFAEVKRDGLTEHGFPRLTANIGILIAHGLRPNLLPVFLEMMDFCCESFLKVKAANDFSVKEIIFCLMLLEEKRIVPKPRIDKWKALLAAIVPQDCYSCYASAPDDRVYNWALFTAVSEYMRQHIGLCDSRDFIDIQLASQLYWVDENGMYQDAPPTNPMMYDLVGRALFAVLLHFGYRGKYYHAIDAALKKSGPLMLEMQSVSGEIPFGGRSAQFIHNEAQQAILCEYEARRYAKEGNFSLAARFKAGAEKSLDCIEAWLNERPIRHVKNSFPTESNYGCEAYAYFNKYMITTASFLYAACLLCDDAIPSANPDASRPYVLALPPHFHKIFLAAGDYFLEWDTCADPHYDCSGLGRIHKKGAPSALCLSLPCPQKPDYTIDLPGAIDLSLCAGYRVQNADHFALSREVPYEILSSAQDAFAARITLRNLFSDQTCLITSYCVDASGVQISLTGTDDLCFLLPAFTFDGRDHTQLQWDDHSLAITYRHFTCRYTTDGCIEDSGKMGCNRNGHYKAFVARGRHQLSIHIGIMPA
ncbi:MAG: hypothetical protein E7324_01540 [Clostridiales bacterium]|nr:hypothetical protein [Clostridiales bacterium]